MPTLHRFGPPPEGALPPQQVRFIEVRVEPLVDGRKLRVYIQLTPFLENPNLEISICSDGEEEISHASIIETAEDRFVLTMHLRIPEIPERLKLSASVAYEEVGTVDTRSLDIEMPSPFQSD